MFKPSTTNPGPQQMKVYIEEEPSVVVPISTISYIQDVELLGALVTLLSIGEAEADEVAKGCGVSVDRLRELVRKLSTLGFVNITTSGNMIVHASPKKRNKTASTKKKRTRSDRDKILKALHTAFYGPNVTLPGWQYKDANVAFLKMYETVRKDGGHDGNLCYDEVDVGRTAQMVRAMKNKAERDGLTVSSPKSVIFLLPEYRKYLRPVEQETQSGLLSA